jgi:chemotaxis methyl-accepting protein methylase
MFLGRGALQHRHDPEGKLAHMAQADLRILATDIDPGMVAAARRGVYSPQQVGEAPPAILKKNLAKQRDGDGYAVDPR